VVTGLAGSHPRLADRHGDALRTQYRADQDRLGRRLLDDRERRAVVRDLLRRGTAASSGALALASTWLLSLASSGPAIGVLESRLHQDVIYAPVPEPSIVLLMAGGLLGVTVATRRKARAKA